jgi:hypothetical protein
MLSATLPLLASFSALPPVFSPDFAEGGDMVVGTEAGAAASICATRSATLRR